MINLIRVVLFTVFDDSLCVNWPFGYPRRSLRLRAELLLIYDTDYTNLPVAKYWHMVLFTSVYSRSLHGVTYYSQPQPYPQIYPQPRPSPMFTHAACLKCIFT